MNGNGIAKIFDPELEPLLKENPNKYVIFPIKYGDIWNMYKEVVGSIWSADEINLDKVIKY